MDIAQFSPIFELMNRRINILWPIVLIWGIITAGCGSSGPKIDAGPGIDTLTPHFSLVDTAGKSHSPEEWLGQEVALVFSVNSCGHCEELIADLAINPPASFTGKVVVMYQCDGVGELKGMIETTGLQHLALVGDMRTFHDYKVKYTPLVVVVGKDGKVKSNGPASNSDKIRGWMDS